MATIDMDTPMENTFRLRPIVNKRGLNFTKGFTQWEAQAKKDFGDVYDTKFKIMPKSHYFVDPPKKKVISEGEQKLKAFEDLLYNGYSIMLNRFQKEFAILCEKASLPLIMGEEEWVTSGPSILKKRKWSVPKKMVAGLSNRRQGKTYFMIRFAVTLAKISPGKRIMLASTAQRISNESKQTAYGLCKEIDLKILKHNQENMWVSEEWKELQGEDPTDPTVTKMGFYPSNPKIDVSKTASPYYHRILLMI